MCCSVESREQLWETRLLAKDVDRGTDTAEVKAFAEDNAQQPSRGSGTDLEVLTCQ